MKGHLLKPLLTVVTISLVMLFAFRAQLVRISDSLPDSRDYPFCVWVIYQNIGHFRSFNFGRLFESNTFYPFNGTLLFSELFLPISIVGLWLSFWLSNPILVFNILFFLTIFLDVLAASFFWRGIFKREVEILIATLFTVVSPFVFQNLPHFQSLNFWPLLFALGLICRGSRTRRMAVGAGIFLAIQFLSNTYLGIMAVPIVLFWYGLEVILERKGYEKGLAISHAIHTMLGYLMLSGFFIFKYLQIRDAYNITREYGDYITYSAQITDYFFSTGFRSLITKLPVVAGWNARSVHGSLFPTATLSGLTLLFFWLRRKVLANTKKITHTTWFFFGLTVGGFVASLGPRLVINGAYQGTVLPYWLVLKLIPALAPIRVVERWAFFFFLGLVYFAAMGFSHLERRAQGLAVLVVISAYLVEVFPLNLPLESITYYPEVYQLVASECASAPKIMLEYPIEQDLGNKANILTNLSYRTGYILASIRHKCNLVNGYSGYFPDDFLRYQRELMTAVEENDRDDFHRLLRQRGVQIFKLNKEDIYVSKSNLIKSWLDHYPGAKVMADTTEYYLIKL